MDVKEEVEVTVVESVGLVASVAWMKNCSTTVYATVLQGGNMITFQE